MSDKKTFLESNSVEHTVGGEELKFHPLSMALVFKLRSVISSVAQSFTVLFQNRTHDQTTRHISQKDGSSLMEAEAINPKLSQQREDSRERALVTLTQQLLNEKTGWLMSMMVMDSLREEYPDYKGDEKVAKAFLNSVRLDRMVELLTGVAKANAEVLAPLGLATMSESVANKIRMRIAEDAGSDPETSTSEPATETTGEN